MSVLTTVAGSVLVLVLTVRLALYIINRNGVQ